MGRIVSESLTRQSAIVEIQFDIVQREPILAYLARRPSGFPTVFEDGERVLEASDEGWYDPYPIAPTDGKPLADGFEWQSSADGAQFILRRYPTKVLALALRATADFSPVDIWHAVSSALCFVKMSWLRMLLSILAR